MSVPITQLQILRLILQIEQNLNGLQRDMRANALSWQAAATAQSSDVTTIAGWMNSAATAYQTRLSWIPALQSDAVTWSKCGALWTALGGTAAEFTSLMTPFNAVATQLSTIDKSSYAAILSVCTQILAAINSPLSLWPE